MGAVLAKQCCCALCTLLSYIGEQLHIQTKQKPMYRNPHADLSASPCVYCGHKVSIGMAERDNMGKSNSLSPLERLPRPQPHAPITYLCC